jgi:hypothetical protein
MTYTHAILTGFSHDYSIYPDVTFNALSVLCSDTKHAELPEVGKIFPLMVKFKKPIKGSTAEILSPSTTIKSPIGGTISIKIFEYILLNQTAPSFSKFPDLETLTKHYIENL